MSFASESVMLSNPFMSLKPGPGPTRSTSASSQSRAKTLDSIAVCKVPLYHKVLRRLLKRHPKLPKLQKLCAPWRGVSGKAPNSSIGSLPRRCCRHPLLLRNLLFDMAMALRLKPTLTAFNSPFIVSLLVPTSNAA